MAVSVQRALLPALSLPKWHCLRWGMAQPRRPAPPSPPPELLLRETDGVIRPLNPSDWFYQFVGTSIVRGILRIPDYKPNTESRLDGTFLMDLKGETPRSQVAVFLDRMLRMAL